MTEKELAKALERLFPGQSLRQQTAELGKALGRDQRTVMRWYYGETPVPAMAAIAIRALEGGA